VGETLEKKYWGKDGEPRHKAWVDRGKGRRSTSNRSWGGALEANRRNMDMQKWQDERTGKRRRDGELAGTAKHLEIYGRWTGWR